MTTRDEAGWCRSGAHGGLASLLDGRARARRDVADGGQRAVERTATASDGLELATASDADTAEASPPRDGYEPIVVHLEESVEPEDVDDNSGCGLAGGASATTDADGTPAPTGQALDGTPSVGAGQASRHAPVTQPPSG